MAIFHLSVKRIGGNRGCTAVSAAAYHAGKSYRNECNGTIHNYANRRGAARAADYHSGKNDFTHKSDIIHNEVMLSKHAPEVFKDAEILWNSVESAKKQHNEQTARMIVVALPNEFTAEQNIEFVRNFVKSEFVDDGMCADFSIHAGHIHDKKDESYPFQDLAIRKENPHAHIQLTTRPLNADGTWANKTRREYFLDKNGNRIRQKNGKGWQSRNINLTDWEKTETLLKWRKDWADTVNREFERLGIDERISHLSLKQQGIEREPTRHMGHKAWALEKKGIKTEIGNSNRAILSRNRALRQLEKEARLVRDRLAGVQKEREISRESGVEANATDENSEGRPEEIADKMHELKQGYMVADGKIAEIKHKIGELERAKMFALAKAEEIAERAEYIQSLTARIDEMRANRRDYSGLLRSHEQAVGYFRREHGITPAEAEKAIKQHEIKAGELEQARKTLEDRLPALLVDREFFKLEHYKRRLLAEVSRDRERILARFERLEAEALKAESSPKKLMARMQRERGFAMTGQDLERILRGVAPGQREKILGLRGREKERVWERDKYRGR